MTEEPLPVDQLSYEQAYAALVKIVSTLEENQATLDEAIALYERGQMLARRCADLLDQAELKVKILSGNHPTSEDKASQDSISM
ncbi:MAG: exodeoxyribonuclease VII small subunit [Anaerolineae bacterium]|nr:exodeoxyribonuclease VII small subunit [Anaerolineae bacterium]